MAPFAVRKAAEISPQNQLKVNSYRTLSDEKKKELKHLEDTCNDFESIFVYQLLKEMQKTVNKTKLVHGGMAEDVFQDMLDQEKSKNVNIGFGGLLFQQLSLGIAPKKPRS